MERIKLVSVLTHDLGEKKIKSNGIKQHPRCNFYKQDETLESRVTSELDFWFMSEDGKTPSAAQW